jgi:FkbM family methyltransferase
MRVFVDVGAHYGEALEIALDPDWGFEKILLLEPAAACQPLLRKFRDHRIEIFPVAIGKKNSAATLYGAGQLGASLFKTKRQKTGGDELKNETVKIVRASEWFRQNVPRGAEVYMKFNCEGAECDIIDDLLDAGFAGQMTSLYVDFDVRKVADLAYRQYEVEARLHALGLRYRTPEDLGLNGAAGVGSWLGQDCPRLETGNLEKLRYRIGLAKPAYLQFKTIIRHIVPTTLYWWLGRRFGRLARSGD